jgi:hypothetical protein
VNVADVEYPLHESDPHAHEWRDLSELDGRHRSYPASVCTLCGVTQID